MSFAAVLDICETSVLESAWFLNLLTVGSIFGIVANHILLNDDAVVFPGFNVQVRTISSSSSSSLFALN